MVQGSRDRGHALAGLQEERPGICRAEERCDRSPPDRLWPVRRSAGGARFVAPICGFPALFELLPALVQAEEEMARRRTDHQALSCPGATMRPGFGASSS